MCTHFVNVIEVKDIGSCPPTMPARLRSQRGGWLRGAAAAALVAGASACTFLTAPGSPLPAAFEDASTWSAATLSSRTKGQCHFMLNDP